ncbi:hypothetical protein A8C32_16760 [Flavivirga aquatica]|uniref:Uncharacterized protein n=1 Tax=Flavivirga aquatica TaxID=1849968 RepID=A0A1E5T8K7_9FLAO|nr:hypothetical protein [Flavivirga aquatica]OEK07704.1 hypothetical protein A8C32_16760 [Flavivirga aquatica]
MKELNENLNKLIEDYRNNLLSIDEVIVKFECLINQYYKKIKLSKKASQINEVEKLFLNIILKIGNIKNIDNKLENRKETNVELRRELGLI